MPLAHPSRRDLLRTTAQNPRPFRRPRYFAVTYFADDEALPDARQHVFRSKTLQRARRIANTNMPNQADEVELVEISRREFRRRRLARWAVKEG